VMTGTLWVLLVATGLGLMWAMRWTRSPMLDAALIRAAAFSYAGAGVIGAQGWIGQSLRWMVESVNRVGAQAGSAGVGTAAVWVVWAGLAIMWVLTLLPERWFSKPIPDWLAISGVMLPGMAASIPGPLGAGLSRVITAAGGLMVNLVSYAFGTKSGAGATR